MDSRTILLVEDNPKDEILTLRSLKKCHVANEVVVLRDGAGRCKSVCVNGLGFDCQ